MAAVVLVKIREGSVLGGNFVKALPLRGGHIFQPRANVLRVKSGAVDARLELTLLGVDPVDGEGGGER